MMMIKCNELVEYLHRLFSQGKIYFKFACRKKSQRGALLNIVLQHFVILFLIILYLIQVHWQLWNDSDMTGDVLPTSGSVTILDMQQNAEINLKLLADDIPELDEVYTIRLVSVEGGADLDEDKDWTRFIVPANDDPYGLFAIYPERQSVIVESDLNRYYQINITRHGGTFQDVIVEYKIIFHREGFATGELLGHVLVRDGANFAIAKVPISNRVSTIV